MVFICILQASTVSAGNPLPKKKIAICYWGLTRSTKKVYLSHYENLFNVLSSNQIDYDVFMHTWQTGGKQRVWEDEIKKPIDYKEYRLLAPDYYQIDDQDAFQKSLDFSQYFYQDVYDQIGHCKDGEWLPGLVLNHVCALESLKRVTNMVMETKTHYDFVIYVRPDVLIETKFPVKALENFKEKDILIPSFEPWEGYNDRFAVLNYEEAPIYGSRIDGLADFRKTEGRIVSEKYVKYICEKNRLNVKLIDFNFKIIRP